MRHLLTDREIALLSLVANGLTIRVAAERMGIKEQSAKNNLSFIYSKLGASNRFQAFMEMGWLTPPEIALDNDNHG